MEEYAGRILADRYRLPLPPSDEFDLVETRAFDTRSGQEVLVRQVPLPEIVDAELLDGEPAGHAGYAGHPGPAPAARRAAGGATRRPTDPAVRRAIEAAQSAARIPDHPRLDQVFDVFAEGGSLWIVSELVRARPLAALLADRPLNPFRAAEVASDVLTALRVLHAHGWTHRNITVRTVLVCEDGRVVLTGLAAGAAEEALCGYDVVPAAEDAPPADPGPPATFRATGYGSGPGPRPTAGTPALPRTPELPAQGPYRSAAPGPPAPTGHPDHAHPEPGRPDHGRPDHTRPDHLRPDSGLPQPTRQRPPAPGTPPPGHRSAGPASPGPEHTGNTGDTGYTAAGAPPAGPTAAGTGTAGALPSGSLPSPAGPAALRPASPAGAPGATGLPGAPTGGAAGNRPDEAELRAAARAGAVAAYRAGAQAAARAAEERRSGPLENRPQGSTLPQGYSYPYGDPEAPTPWHGATPRTPALPAGYAPAPRPDGAQENTAPAADPTISDPAPHGPGHPEVPPAGSGTPAGGPVPPAGVRAPGVRPLGTPPDGPRAPVPPGALPAAAPPPGGVRAALPAPRPEQIGRAHV